MKKYKRIFYIVLGVLLLFAIYLDTYLILKYNVLPTKYLLWYAGIVGLIPIILIAYTIFRKKHWKLKGFLAGIEIIYIIVLLLGFVYLDKTFNFIDVFTSSLDYETKSYYVLVLKDSTVDKIDGLANKKIGYSTSFDSSAEHALKDLNKKVKLESESYDNYALLYEALDSKTIDSVLMFGNSYDMLIENEEESNENYSEKYKIIYKFSIKEEITPMETKNVNITKDTFNIYISGMDSYGSITDKSRSDVNIIMSVNPKTNKILLVSIPRDYYVELHGKGQKDKLTHAGVYGIDTSVKTIEDLLDVDINYYMKVNFSAVVKLVDALGGVDVESQYDFSSYELHHRFKVGMNHVNGKQALDFVRTRKAFKDGDRVRGENQQAMIKAIIDKMSSSAILYNYENILKSMEGNFVTNMSTENITELIKMQLDKNPKWQIEPMSLNGSDGHETTYSTPNQVLYVMIPDEETVEAAKSALKEMK